jgi:hypothetical protein
MSELTHPLPQALRSRVPLPVWLAAAALIASAAIAVFIAISGDDEATQTPSTAVTDTATGIRYDGGPNEGTRGLVRPDSAPIARYDGGPEESGHGIRHSSAVSAPPAGSRYDGGPEEGTRGVPSTSAPSTTAAGIRFDGGPEEGSRGLGR